MVKKLQYAINPEVLVAPPSRGTAQSAGVDVYMPTFTKGFLRTLKEKNPNINQIRPDSYSYFVVKLNDREPGFILLGPGERLLIPSGIHVNLDQNIVQIAFNKSGVASKKGLVLGACVIDEDYQGQIHINVINTSNNMVMIHEGEKLTQFIELLTYYSELEELPFEDLYKEVSERGAGGFGSTNKSSN